MGFTRQSSPQGTLMAVSTMKDEGPFVLEWVAHHLAVGFTDVLVYTNDCTDGTDTMLKRLAALDIGVQHRVNAVPAGVKPQPAMLKLAADEPALQAADWMLILDADEFLCVNHPSGSVGGMVADLAAIGASAMVLTWRIFGSSGIQDWSRAPVTDQFTRAAPEHWNKGWGTKTLFRPDPRHLRPGIHRPIIKSQHRDGDYPDSVLWVNGSGRPLENWFKLRGWRSVRRTVGYDWAQVNHYAIKSMDAYALRKLRGNVNLKADKYNTDYWALQDRNEVEDRSIARHRDRRDQILAWFLQDPKLRKLHDAAHARVEARLADHRATPDYAELIAGLVAASDVPINQVVAKPPKPRDRAAARKVEAKVEKTGTAEKTKRSAPPPPGWGSAFASPYISGPVDFSVDLPMDQVENLGLVIPLDPRVFTAATLQVLRSGKFERRNARTIGGLLGGCTRLLDLDCGIGFVGLRARLGNPGLTVLLHDESPALQVVSRRAAALNFPDPTGIGWSRVTLNPDALWSGLVRLVAETRPDVLRLSGPGLTPDALTLADLSSVRRVLFPFLDPSETTGLRARHGATLAGLGFAEDPAAEANGSLCFRRD